MDYIPMLIGGDISLPKQRILDPITYYRLVGRRVTIVLNLMFWRPL
jgi:hypothetical protein